MRTPEQIKNLRTVMAIMGIPMAFILPDEVVNTWADSMQKTIDSIGSVKQQWQIKIRGFHNKNELWIDIKPEPKNPYCSYRIIESACYNLLIKYPRIYEIEVSNCFDKEEKYYINREK